MKEYQIREDYCTGNEKIDRQHASMLGHIQAAHQLFADENMLFKCADIRKMLEGLDFYAQEHFADEEEYMEQIGYDGLEAHRKQHEAFRVKIREFIDSIPELTLDTQDRMLGEVFEYLDQWWNSHIANVDRQYVIYSRKKEEADG